MKMPLWAQVIVVAVNAALIAIHIITDTIGLLTLLAAFTLGLVLPIALDEWIERMPD